MNDRPYAQIRHADATGMVDGNRDRLSVLVEQQAALRRVATLVARGASPSEVFAAVAEEMANCLHAGNAGVTRFDGDTAATLVALANLDPGMKHQLVVGERVTIGGDNWVSAAIRAGQVVRIDPPEDGTGSAARVRDMGINSIVAVPVNVDGHIWGSVSVGSYDPLPADTEERISDFAELVATAIANAATRDQLRQLAEQQAALRRVATLVARAASPSEVFSAVAEEMVSCLHVENASVMRYESGDAAIVLAVAALEPKIKVPTEAIGTRVTLEGDNTPVMTLRTGRPARMESFENATGSLAETLRGMGLRSGVSVPIVVGGRMWGTASAGSPRPMPPGTEARMADFADLVATSIANAATRDELIATRDELIASRARIVAAADDARRRLERDLHDGAQQRLVSLALKLRVAEQLAAPEHAALQEHLSEAVSGLSGVLHDLQEISRGIHPAILSDGGLKPALKTLARRCPIPANVDVIVERRLPDSVEVAAYYVVAEALTNAAKYADASQVSVCAEIQDANLCLSIQDDGVGGADARKGSGLIGLKDRVEVLGGHMKVISPPGIGTSLHVTIPLHG